MSYFAESNHIEYDAWFDENIDPLDLMDYLDEKDFSDSVHYKLYSNLDQILLSKLQNVEIWLNDYQP